jgi:acyl-CoA synthetase (NDP forming)
VVDEVDILHYLMNDEKTKVIIFYIEGVKRGREFLEIGRRTSMKKPVVIMKGGTTEEGAKAAQSHTASLAGGYESYEAVFRQAGFVIAEDMSDMLSFGKIFETQPKSTGKRVAVITNGGGTGVLATDAIVKNHLEMAVLSKDSERILRKAMPPIVNIRLPLDMAGDADDRRFGVALETISKDPNVDMIMAIALFQTPGADSRVAEMLVRYGTTCGKPLVVISAGGSYTQEQRMTMESQGIPVYDSPGAAAKALAALSAYSRYVERLV